MSQVATEGTQTVNAAVETWIDRAAVVLKTILPLLPDDQELSSEVAELLTELGEDYFVETPESAVDAALEQTEEEPVDAKPAPASDAERLAFSIAALRIFVEHSTATGETMNAMVDYIEKTNETLPGDKVAEAAEWARAFEQAAWPS